MKKIITFSCFALFIGYHAIAQDTAKVNNAATKEVIRTDANLKSGNTKDIFANFFRLAYDDLSGEERAFNFSSNLFALKLKANPNTKIDYSENRFLRNSNINFSLKLDSSNKLYSPALGYSINIINKRDYKLSKEIPLLISKASATYNEIFDSLSTSLSAQVQNADELIKLNQALNKFFMDKNIEFGDLDEDTKAFVRKNIPQKYNTILKDDWSFSEEVKDNYLAVLDTFKNKLLWNAAINTSQVSSAKFFSNYQLISQATANLFNLNKTDNVAFDLKAEYDLSPDSMNNNKAAGRQKISFEGGANAVFRNSVTEASNFEFKLSVEYNNILKGIYANETKENFTLNGTLRIRVINSIYIPLELKYDPKNANVLGLISVRSNFDWLGNKKN